MAAVLDAGGIWRKDRSLRRIRPAEPGHPDYRVNGRKSLDRAELSVKHLGSFFARTRAMDITPDRVSAFIRTRLEKAKPATIRLELAALGRMFTLATRAGKVSHRPHFPSIEVRNTRSGFFEEAELRAVLGELHRDLRPLVQFVALTGWRIGEARQLTWRQVDFDSGTVRLEPGSTKNDEGRVFPFAALPALEALLHAQREHTSALARERGQLISVGLSSLRQARAELSRGVAGRVRASRCRRTVYSRPPTLGGPEPRAGERATLGRHEVDRHKTESIYRRYAIVCEADLSEGVRKLAASRDVGASSPRVIASISARRSTEQAQTAVEGGDA